MVTPTSSISPHSNANANASASSTSSPISVSRMIFFIRFTLFHSPVCSIQTCAKPMRRTAILISWFPRLCICRGDPCGRPGCNRPPTRCRYPFAFPLAPATIRDGSPIRSTGLSASTGRAPISNRCALSVDASANTGFPSLIASRHSASIFPPASAWAIRRVSASAAMLCVSFSRGTYRGTMYLIIEKGQNREAAIIQCSGFHIFRMRILPNPRAGQTNNPRRIPATAGAGSSFSIGD